jgi:hypothetical protein
MLPTKELIFSSFYMGIRCSPLQLFLKKKE